MNGWTKDFEMKHATNRAITNSNKLAIHYYWVWYFIHKNLYSKKTNSNPVRPTDYQEHFFWWGGGGKNRYIDQKKGGQWMDIFFQHEDL